MSLELWTCPECAKVFTIDEQGNVPHYCGLSWTPIVTSHEAAARDQATPDGLAAAQQAWKREAIEVIEDLAAHRGHAFSADDVTNAMQATTHDNRALGGILVGLKNKGLIEHIGYRPSSRKGNHKGPRSMWRGVGAVC